jgi:hypothetical protein
MRQHSFVLVPSLALICLLGVSCGGFAKPLEIDSFNANSENWFIYDYNGGVTGGGNVFYPSTWSNTGGVDDSGYVWGDDSQWRIDTPEAPNSILSFITYREWLGKEPLDLRDAQVSVYLRGDGLDLKGAKVYFWVVANDRGARYHLDSHPLQVTDTGWGQPLSFDLPTNESLWHNSWQRNPGDPASLMDVLSAVDSYGFSFIGFPNGVEVIGKFAMDEMTISAVPEPASATSLIAGGLILLAVAMSRRRGVAPVRLNTNRRSAQAAR